MQSVVDKRCEYKYGVIAILAISAITSKHIVYRFDFDQIMVRHRAKCVFIVCKLKLRVCGLFEISTIDQPVAEARQWPVAEARQLEAELSSG